MTELEQIDRLNRLTTLVTTLIECQTQAAAVGLARIDADLEANKTLVLDAIKNVASAWIYAIESNEE